MKAEDLAPLSDNDIIARRVQVMRELVKLHIQLRTGQLEDNSLVKKTRRALARLNTELRSREISQSLAKGTLVGRSVPKTDEGEAPAEAAVAGKRSRFGLGFIRDALLGRRSE